MVARDNTRNIPNRAKAAQYAKATRCAWSFALGTIPVLSHTTDKDWAPSQSPQRRPAVPPQGKTQLWTSWGRGKADTLHVRLAFCTSTARSAGTGCSGQQQKFESSIQRVWSGSWDGCGRPVRWTKRRLSAPISSRGCSCKGAVDVGQRL